MNMDYLDPATVRFRRNPAGTLDLLLGDGTVIADVSCMPMFPMRSPERLISVVRSADRQELTEVAVIRELQELPAGQQELVREQIGFRYFVPLIRDIRAITPVADLFELELVTDRGLATILMQNPRESVAVTDDGIMTITDIEKCRYRILRFTDLPLRARLLLEKILL